MTITDVDYLSRIVQYQGPKALCISGTAILEETALAYATDTDELGLWITGTFIWFARNGGTVTGSHTIMDEGSTLPHQPVLNFIGNSIWAVNNPGQSRTDIIVSGTSSGGGHTIENEGTPLTQRTNLNFVGASVDVTDDAGNDRTIVTVSPITGSGGGDVYGDASGVDGHMVLFDDDGYHLKDGGVPPTGTGSASNLASASYTRTAGTYTLATGTFVDVDATNMKLTITTGARRVLVVVSGMATSNVGTGYVYLDVDLDGTRLSNQANGIITVRGLNGDWYPIGFSWLTDILSAGSHIFKLQWRATTGTTASLYGAGSAWPLRFSVAELYTG